MNAPPITAEPDGSYRVGEGRLSAGATLGGPRVDVKLLASGAIDVVHSVDSAANLISGFDVTHFDEATRIRLSRRESCFTLRPECQVQVYRLAGDIHVEKTTFALGGDHRDPAAAYVWFRIRNEGRHRVCLSSVATARLKGNLADNIEAWWEERANAIVVRSMGEAGNPRAIVCSERPASWAISGDHARVIDDLWRGPFPGEVDCDGLDPLGCMHLDAELPPGGATEFWFEIAALARDDGITVQKERRGRAAPGKALAATRRRYDELLARTVVMTPVREIDLGVHWAKANMVRVMRQTPTGPGFTNDPARSSACVGRDAAWFVHGCDWLDPEFSRALLRRFAERQEADGKIVEYYDLCSGATADYGLNVNDNTPLFVLAVWHHAAATGDRTFLEEAYEPARRAIAQLLDNRDERGLVFCTSTETCSQGIVGWRNIIPGYRLSGATTELNSTTYAALKKMSELAKTLGREADLEHFDREAAALHAAIEKHLRNRENGLYYLTLDVDGRARSEITADLVFPVIFGVADDATCARIVERLREADFWTDAGLRTVPRNAPEYNPTFGSGLLGGVWVAVTFWYAFAASRFVPDIMLEALQKGFSHYARDPRTNNTVPGQFSEWLHGETLVNEGMMLSPWFPPRYVWAAVEGACGFEPSPSGARIAPRLPPSWSWLGARNVPFHGKPLAWFFARTDCDRVFATRDVESDVPVEVYDRDVTDDVLVEGEDVAVIAFARGDRTIVFVGNRAPHTTTVAVRREGALAGKSVRRRFESFYGGWKNELDESGRATNDDAFAVTIARGLFALIEFA